jgi:hypothetical protein
MLNKCKIIPVPTYAIKDYAMRNTGERSYSSSMLDLRLSYVPTDNNRGWYDRATVVAKHLLK